MIDFLHDLFFGPDLPHVTKFLTGMEIAMIAQLVGDLGSKAFTASKAQKQRSEGERIAEEATKKIQEAKFTVGQETRDVAELQKQQFEDLQDLIKRNQMAMSQQAIASAMGDPTRTSAQVSPLLDQLGQQSLQTNLQLGQQKAAVDEQLANLTEQYNLANIKKDLDLQSQIRQEGQAAASLGFATGAETGASAFQSPANMMDTALAIGQLTGEMPFGMANGGKLDNQIYMTGGEFDHDSNKKALVDEETGEKEAELTGEEAVLNPEQTNRTMQAAEILFNFLEQNPNAPEEVRAVAKLLEFLNDPQFQGPDAAEMPEDAVEEGEIDI